MLTIASQRSGRAAQSQRATTFQPQISGWGPLEAAADAALVGKPEAAFAAALSSMAGFRLSGEPTETGIASADEHGPDPHGGRDQMRGRAGRRLSQRAARQPAAATRHHAKPPLCILLLGDSVAEAEQVQASLEADGLPCDIMRVQTRAQFECGLEDPRLDLVLADDGLPSFDGIAALKLTLKARPDLPFIFVADARGEEEAVIDAIKVGASDYVLKSKLSRLGTAVQRAMREADEKADRNKAEQALRRSAADLAEAKLREFEADLARINRISMMGELAASLAHEIKQPITGVAINAATCLRWLEGDAPRIEDVRRKLSAILENVKRATDIINRNQALYGRGHPRLEAIDLNETIRHVVALLHDAADRNCVAVRTELDPELVMTTADPVQLQQVLMNLMLNGIEAMMEGGGVLTITSGPGTDGRLMISVSDCGVGLPAEGAERVFEAFFTTKPDGTGIGLPLSRRIIESHGGRLWASANAPRGAVFHFTVPIIQPQ